MQTPGSKNVILCRIIVIVHNNTKHEQTTTIATWFHNGAKNKENPTNT